jgi:hypothetical protein
MKSKLACMHTTAPDLAGIACLQGLGSGADRVKLRE